LLPRRHEALRDAVDELAIAVEAQATRLTQDWRRQTGEQLAELRGLRGKSSGKTATMVARVKAEAQEFERGASKVTAVRAIHVRMLRAQLLLLATTSLREEVGLMKQALQGTVLNLGARKAFAAFFTRLRDRLEGARRHGAEAQEMLEATFKQLNAEFGFSLSLTTPPRLVTCEATLAQLEANYGQYLGVSNALKMGDKHFVDQFVRMLTSKLMVAFEQAGTEIEHWHRSTSSQLDSQLRDRRVAFARRQEALERIVGAQDELESRITELESQDRRLGLLQQHTQGLVHDLRRSAANKPAETGGMEAHTQPAALDDGKAARDAKVSRRPIDLVTAMATAQLLAPRAEPAVASVAATKAPDHVVDRSSAPTQPDALASTAAAMPTPVRADVAADVATADAGVPVERHREDVADEAPTVSTVSYSVDEVDVDITTPMSFDVRPRVPVGFHVESHTDRPDHVDTHKQPLPV
jgi:hypothetical protein